MRNGKAIRTRTVIAPIGYTAAEYIRKDAVASRYAETVAYEQTGDAKMRSEAGESED